MATFDRPPTPEELRPFAFSRPVCSLPVTSIPEAIDYWTTKLPFYLRGRDGNNHCWLQSHTPGADVNVYLRLRGFSGPGRPLAQDDAQSGKVYIRVSGAVDDNNSSGDPDASAETAVKGLHAALATRGAVEMAPVRRMPWGHWTCAFGDLDGNVINFYSEGARKTKPAT